MSQICELHKSFTYLYIYYSGFYLLINHVLINIYNIILSNTTSGKKSCQLDIIK